jgi:hypothetical protein
MEEIGVFAREGTQHQRAGLEDHPAIVASPSPRKRDNMSMRPLAAILMLAAGLASAQMKLTVRQLGEFIRSSIELRHDDRRIAEYLKKVALTEKLDDRMIEEWQGLGAGPRTVDALRALRDASQSLAAAAPPPPKPAPVAIPPPSPAEQKRALAEAREYALNYTKRLPDFICLQVTRRNVDPTGMEFFRQVDTVVTRLSFFEQKEEYKVVLVNDRPMEVDFRTLGGVTSAGEFGSMLREIFEPKTETSFEWQRWATLRGRRMHVFAYTVEPAKSQWTVSWERKLFVTVGYRGLVYVDRDNFMVAKVTLEADMPPTFPIQRASTTLDYDFVTINEQQYVLPLRSETRLREGKFLARNDTEFRGYRKFSAETVITFDTPAPLPEEQIKEQPVVKPPE